MVFINGLIFGLLLSVLIGPVFFTLIQTSIEKGFSKAVLVAVGIFFSDLVCVFLAYLGLSQLIQNSEFHALVGYGGGVILVSFGLFSLFKSRKSTSIIQDPVNVKGFFRYIFKGFFINGVNPSVLVFWIGAMSLATIEYGYKGNILLIFFSTILAIVFTADVIKAYLAGKLRRLVTPRFFKILNVIVGLALIAFGISMFCYV